MIIAGVLWLVAVVCVAVFVARGLAEDASSAAGAGASAGAMG